MDLEDISLWIDEVFPQFLKDLDEICSIRSVADVSGKEQKPYGRGCADVLEKMLQMGEFYGLESKNYDNYVGKLFDRADKDKASAIGIWSHLDVVDEGTGWQYPPYKLTVKDGYAIARGANDNKSSAIIALYVLRYLKEHNVSMKNRIEAYFGTCEEQGMYDIDYFLEHYKCPDFSLVPDCGFPVCCGERGAFNGRLVSERLGNGRLISLKADCGLYDIPDYATVTIEYFDGIEDKCAKAPADCEVVYNREECQCTMVFHGVSGHAAVPSSGDSALTKMVHFLTENEILGEDTRVLMLIDKMNADYCGTALDAACEDEWSGHNIMNVTRGFYEGGHLIFDFISKYPVSKNDIDFKERAALAAKHSGYILEVTRYRKASFLSPDNSMVKCLTDVWNEITGHNDKPFIMSGGTYAGKLPNAIAFGTGISETKPEKLFLAGHGDYHQPDESISIHRMKLALYVYIKAMLKLNDI